MVAQFHWTQKRRDAAVGLAEGKTQQEVAREAEASRRTICYWLEEPEFSAEVDRLSQMIGIAGKAERMRIAMRTVRQKVKGETVETNKDLLDWLRFAQSETDGVKLDLTKLAASFERWR